MKKRKESFSALLPLVLLTLGHALLTTAAFPSLNVAWHTAWLFLCCASILLYVLQRTRACRYVLVVTGAATVLFVLLSFHAYSYLLYDFCAAMQRASGHIYLASDPKGRLWPLWVLFLLGGALLQSRAAVTGNLLYLVPMLVPMLEGSVLAVVPVGAGTGFVVVGLLLMIGVNGTHWRVALQRSAAVILCAALTVCIGYVFHNAPQERAVDRLRATFHTLVFDLGSKSTPEGDLQSVKPFQKDEKPVLAITMERPQATYLRGSIYETYTGLSWKPLSAAARAEYGAFFSWIHANGFFGQSQIYTILTAVDNPDVQTVSIRNLHTCRAHGYLPYGAGGTLSLDESLIGDALIPSRIRTFSCVSTDAEALRDASGKLSSGAYDSLSKMEQSMGAYAQNVDLSIPSDVMDLLYREYGSPTAGSTGSILREVRTFLQRTLTYDESAETHSDKDFLQTLFESKCGCSVHYATAAVMLLRWNGVPARYVEGYYLTPEKAKDASAGEEIVLTRSDAHAWAEYYLDGVGFVPFEVTPGYTEADEEQIESRMDPESVKRPRSPASTPETVSPQTPEGGFDKKKPVFPVLWLAAALVLLLSGWILLRLLRMQRMRRLIDASNNREAILRLYGYMCALRRFCKAEIPDEEKARQLYEQARFSDHEMTRTHRDEMECYCTSVKKICMQSWNPLQRFYYRILRGVMLPNPK